MRKFLAIALLAAGFSAPSAAQAQSPGSSGASSGYEAQKVKFKAARFESVAQLRALGKGGGGQVVELRGQVKGSFAREGARAILFQLGQGESVVIDAPDTFKTLAATFPGAISRFLCRVASVPESGAPTVGASGANIALTLIAATDAPDPDQLFKNDDTDAVVAPPGGETLPPPDQIMIGADDSASDPNATPMRIVVGGSAPAGPAPKRTGNVLPSRGLPRGTQSRRAASPYFGFDASQRAAYSSLARRNNPKLDSQMADYIAGSILAAAQANSLDPRFLAAIVTVESSFDPYCLSSSGAMGLGQLMPFNLRPLGVSNAWDPGQNLKGSAKLLRQNLDTFARQPDGTLLAVAAYHAGVGAVIRAGKAVPPRASTQRYVWKVYYAYRALAPELFPR